MPVRHPFKRAERVSDVLRQVISEILMKRMHHLGVEGVTVTGVKMSDDLQHARVFYRVFDPLQRVEIARSLGKVSGTLRRDAAREMKMKYVPELTFEYDESLEYGHRIDELLSSVSPRSSGEEE